MKLRYRGMAIIMELREGLQILFSYGEPIAAYLDGSVYQTGKALTEVSKEHIESWLDVDIKDMPHKGYVEFKDHTFFKDMTTRIVALGVAGPL